MKRLRSGRLIGPPDAGVSEALEKKVLTLQQQLRALQDTARARHETLQARLLACEAARSADVAQHAARLSTLEQQLATLTSQVGRLEGAPPSKGASSSSSTAGRPALPTSQYLSSLPFHWSELVCKKFGAFYLMDGNPLIGVNSNSDPFQLLCAHKALYSGSFSSYEHLKFDVVFDGAAYNIVGFMAEQDFGRLLEGKPPATGCEIHGSISVNSRATVFMDAQACRWWLRHENGKMTSPAPLPPCAYFFASSKMCGAAITLTFPPDCSSFHPPGAPRASASSSRARGVEEEEEEG